MRPPYKTSHIARFVGGLSTIAVLIYLIGITASQSLLFRDGEKADSKFTSPESIKYLHVQYAADFTDDRILIGASHNIFVGKVVKVVGSEGRRLGPETQFQVEVIENIKGDLRGAVIVNQLGGYKDNILYAVESGDDEGSGSYLLQPGSTYLFATRFLEEKNWYTLNPHPSAIKTINTDKNSSNGQLAGISRQDSRVAELKAAYPNERLLDEDRVTENDRNSYKSVSKSRVSENANTATERALEENAAESNAAVMSE